MPDFVVVSSVSSGPLFLVVSSIPFVSSLTPSKNH